MWGQCLEYGSSHTGRYLWLRGQSGCLGFEWQVFRWQVQDPAFLAFLRRLGPDLLQGFMAIARGSGEHVPRGIQEPVYTVTPGIPQKE